MPPNLDTPMKPQWTPNDGLISQILYSQPLLAVQSFGKGEGNVQTCSASRLRTLVESSLSCPLLAAQPPAGRQVDRASQRFHRKWPNHLEWSSGWPAGFAFCLIPVVNPCASAESSYELPGIAFRWKTNGKSTNSQGREIDRWERIPLKNQWEINEITNP